MSSPPTPPPPAQVFFTHNWGENSANHAVCRDIARVLKANGIPVWFDEDRMEGQIDKAMVKGIDESSVLLIAVTATYIAKINGDHTVDNCRREFNYALDQDRFANNFVCIVTDEDALDLRVWTGAFRMKVGNPVFTNLCPSVRGEAREKSLQKLCASLKNKFEGREASGGLSVATAAVASMASPWQGNAPAMAWQGNTPAIACHGNTALSLDALVTIFHVLDIPNAIDIARKLFGLHQNSLEKLSMLAENNFQELGVAHINARLVHNKLVQKLAQPGTYEPELDKAASVDGSAKQAVLLTLMARNEQEALAGCKTLHRLLSQTSDKDKGNIALFEAGAGSAILSAMERYAAVHAGVAEQACAAIGSLPGNTDAQVYYKLGELGACEAVADVLKRYSTAGTNSSPHVVEKAFSAMRVLVRGSDASKNKQRFGVAGACETVSAVLKASTTSTACELACWAVSNLAAGHAGNQERLGRAGACEAVVLALKRFDGEDEYLVQAALAAVSNLVISGNSNNQNKLREAGACEAVLDALTRFGEKNEGIALQGLGAIRYLAANAEENQARLVRAGACQVVVDALNRSSSTNEAIALQACGAVRNLASKNQDELGRAGACQAVLAAVKHFGAQSPGLALQASDALRNLARNHSDNTKLLKDLDSATVIKQSLLQQGRGKDACTLQ